MIDYRHLNAVSIPQFLRIHPILIFFDQIGQIKPKVFSTFDAMSGFYQIPLKRKSQDYTAFVTHAGKYIPIVMPMGIASAPQSFQHIMSKILYNLPFAFCYIDDIIIASPCVTSHRSHIEQGNQRWQIPRPATFQCLATFPPFFFVTSFLCSLEFLYF